MISKPLLALEVVRTYWTVRRSVADKDVRNTLARVRDTPLAAAGPAPEDPLAVAPRLSRATTRTLRFLPGDTRCLTQSLVLSALLARRAIPSRLVIGVSPSGEFGAHAWVELLDGHVLLPRNAYERLVDL